MPTTAMMLSILRGGAVVLAVDVTAAVVAAAVAVVVVIFIFINDTVSDGRGSGNVAVCLKVLDPRYTKPGLQAEKNELTINAKGI